MFYTYREGNRVLIIDPENETVPSPNSERFSPAPCIACGELCPRNSLASGRCIFCRGTHGRRVAVSLDGGPYNHRVFIPETLPDYFRFPADPGDCAWHAPDPIPDGPVVYESTRKVNGLGDPIYRFKEVP